MDTKQLRKARNHVNDALYALGLMYHDSIPLYAIDCILTDNGFDPQSEGIFTGRDGRHSEEVGHGVWLHMTWHFMEVTRRWEVVALCQLNTSIATPTAPS